MTRRAGQISFRAAGFATHAAPHADELAMSSRPAAAGITVQRATAKAQDGAGTVCRADLSVAPALPGRGPGIEIFPTCPPTGQIDSANRVKYVIKFLIQSQAGACCIRNSRGDRSRRSHCHMAVVAAGTRSGNGRNVSLSPVPAPHPCPPRRRARQPRNCRQCVAIA